MARLNAFEQAFRDVKTQFKAKTKIDFLKDLAGQLEEDEVISQYVLSTRFAPRLISVSFDRHRNDQHFSYQYVDMALVYLDRLAGGVGIYKPLNQIRVLQWRATKRQLLRTLRYISSNNPRARLRRIIVLPYPAVATGYRLDQTVYRN